MAGHDGGQVEARDLRLAAKLEAMSAVGGGIAHQMNNLLAVILSNVWHARSGDGPAEEIDGALADALAAARRAIELTRQLRMFARGGLPVKTLASLRAVIDESVRLSLAGSSTAAQVDLDEGAWLALFDAEQIGLLFQSLIRNASEAMADGGVVRIACRPVAPVEGRTEPHLHITVEDGGAGILPEHLGRVFDPFFTTKPARLGLGLALAFSIAQRHGGRITVDSELGRGSTFHLYLPATDPVRARELTNDGTSAVRGRILLMDDEDLVRLVAPNLLAGFGYDVEVVSNGAAAIERYTDALARGAAFDAVVLDLTVRGGMGGIEAFNRLREIDPGVRAIASSANAGADVMSDYARHGFRAAVAKPFTGPEMSAALQEVLGDT